MWSTHEEQSSISTAGILGLEFHYCNLRSLRALEGELLMGVMYSSAIEVLLFKKKKVNLVACGDRLQGMNSQKVLVVGRLVSEKQQ